MTDDIGGISSELLQQTVEKLERLEEEKGAIAEQIREAYAEAKGVGFDTKVLRMIIRMRKMDQREIDEQEALVELYKQALGMR
ncbi:MAG: DUF2312 domain-containing protein [Magnetococcales bacterium]|nr:DUF2312 domain-containing protein [Magnetococcales bacterium]